MEKEVGFVKSIRGFLAYLDGLPSVKINDLVESETGLRGYVSALLPDTVEVLLLDEKSVTPGVMFKKTSQRLTISVGNFLLGRAVNPLGVPIDGRGTLGKDQKSSVLELDSEASGINDREFIDKQLLTGVTLVDSLLPLGCGQRELVVGDARSGKTQFLVDVLLNQKNTDFICIYALIGKPLADIKTLMDILDKEKAGSHTIVVATSSTDLPSLIFLTAHAAFTIAEYFAKMGQNVLVVLDDMGIHAKIHREISLLGSRPPGRESYPGDIFYQQSHLLERGGNFKGGGSITALPVIELNLNDFTTFIPTNLMSMTDGHLLFKSSLFNQGKRPAIDISLSVSRVGHQTQTPIQHLLATKIKQVLARAAQLETISHFSFELPYETRQMLTQKSIIEEILQQPPSTFIPVELQTVLLTLPFTSILKEKDSNFVKKYYPILYKAFSEDPELKKITTSVFKLKSLEELITAMEGVKAHVEGLLGMNQESRR